MRLKALDLETFKRKFGVSQARLNKLVHSGRLNLQQSGYRGDNLHHPKLVLFPENFIEPVAKKDRYRSERGFTSKQEAAQRTFKRLARKYHGKIPKKEKED